MSPDRELDAAVLAAGRALADNANLPRWMQVVAWGQDVAPLARLAVDAARPVILDEAAAKVAGMCHWVQNVNGIASMESHTEFHFGFTCPYEAMAAVLRGEPDPRRRGEGGW